MSVAKDTPPVNQIQPASDADFGYQSYLRSSDHDAKAAWLATQFPAVNPYDYYDSIFHGSIPDSMPVQFLDDAAPVTTKAAGFFELQRLARERSAATPLATFYNAWRSRATLENVHALVIDVENVTPTALPVLIDHLQGDFDGRRLMPTYLNLSGGGVHLVYLFTRPAEAYNWRKPYLDGILRALKKALAQAWEVDRKCSTVQAVRIVGGITKYGDACQSYRTGELWDPAALARMFNMVYPENNPHQMKLFDKEAGEVEEKPRKRATVAVLPKSNPSFWRYAWLRLVNRADPGNRHMQLFALAVIGYKCRIPRNAVVERLQTIINIYNEKNPHDPLPGGELEKAMPGYSQKYLRVKSETLAEWTGLEFKKNKRNGRTQEEHLRRVHARRRGGTREEIKSYLRDHPGASQVEIARSLGMDRKNVRRHLREIQGGSLH